MPETTTTTNQSLTLLSRQVGYLEHCDPNYAVQLILEAAQNLPCTAGFEPRTIKKSDTDRLSKMTRSELLHLMGEALDLLNDSDEAITAYYRQQNPEDYA